jgi:hypothetical protein
MLRSLMGVAVGFVCGYLYGSERAREEVRRRLKNAPEPVRQATERISGAVAGAPIPDALKQTASRGTAAAHTTTQGLTQASAPTPGVARPTAAEVAGRPAEPLPCQQPDAPPA